MNSESEKISQMLGIFTTDINFKIQTWNSVMEIFTGIPENQIKGKILFEVFPEIRERNLDKKYLNVIESGQVEFLSSVFHEYLIRVKPIEIDPEYPFMLQSVSIAPLMDGPKLKGTLTTIKDVTDQRKKEKENSLGDQEKTTRKDNFENEKLLAEIENHDWRVRKQAVEMLKETSPDIIEEILIKIKNNHKNLNILNSALQVLLGYSDRVIEALHELINSSDKDLRIYAAQTLGEVRDPEAISILLRALDDPDKNVVYHAIEALGKLKAYEAISILIEIALSDDFFLSFAAVDALKNMHEKVILLHIHKLINKDVFHPLIIEIFRDIGDDSNIPYLIEMLEKSTQNILDIAEALIKIIQRYREYYKEDEYVISIIKRFATEKTHHILLNSLENQNHPKFIFLVELLTLIGDENTLQILFRLLRNTEFKKIIIQNLVRRKDLATKVLLDQIRTADFELKLEILSAIGNFTAIEVLNTLTEYLEEDEDEILITVLNSLAKIGSKEPYPKILKLLKHHSAVVRRAAISTLNSIGHPDMSKDIYYLLFSEDLNELDSAIRIAGYFGYNNCLERMIELYSHNEISIRTAVIEHIGFFQSDKVITILDSALKDINPQIRVAAVKSLMFVPDEKIYTRINEALLDENFWVRIQSIRAIQFLRYSEGKRNIIKLLEYENKEPVIISALQALGDLNGFDVIHPITKFIYSDNIDISLAAIEALGKINHPDSIQPLIENLHSTDIRKKLKSLEALKNLKYESTIEIIKFLALTDGSEKVKLEALNVISEFDTEKSVESLIDLLKDRELRTIAIKNLAKQNIKWLYLFDKALTKDPVPVRIAILEALTLMKNETATKLIIRALDDESPIVRIYAINSIRKLGSREGLKKILHIAQYEKDEQVRTAALNFLSSL